ncbi:hypothetical protein IF1G_10199 [Cordyceps javanica]|uniref:Uncharacterized protein n=1 Tax=Cordyceps javanica TaxID=43265 RepID=A0A545UPC1_9HYPO|nr:hypothetical protein IF1G_10199 [Cordyceps javanica]
MTWDQSAALSDEFKLFVFIFLHHLPRFSSLLARLPFKRDRKLRNSNQKIGATLLETGLALSITMLITRGISLVNFAVASTALGFQVFVLYPWHKELDTAFEELRKEHLKVLDAVGNSMSEKQRTSLSDELKNLKSRSSSRWWWL